MEMLLQKQKEFFFSGKTKPIEFRIEQLKKLRALLKENDTLLFESIYKDFKKSQFETYLTELSQIYSEIDHFIKCIRNWSKPQKVKTNLASWPARSYTAAEPYGVCLVIGAWNYPYNLSLIPAVSAIAAGNTVILKPSELATNTSKVMAKIINENFDSSFFTVVEGGVEVSQKLLAQDFDKIFFTGSTVVGKIVAEAAAKKLIPVTLELGGKSPCFVMNDADLKLAAKKIAWGKFLNAGQTCVAPDYLLVHESIYQPFMKELKKQVDEIIGPAPKQSESYTRIINQKNTERLTRLIDSSKVTYGGDVDIADCFVGPTIMENINFEDKVMEDEIFGPILPVIKFSNLQSIIQQVKRRPKPLALYLFTKSSEIEESILSQISFGGGTINDCILHLSNPHLPFGGVGPSGHGAYHGRSGFMCFSHNKSILKKINFFDPVILYRPYSAWKMKLLRWIFE